MSARPNQLAEQMSDRLTNFIMQRFAGIDQTRAGEIAKALVASYDDGTRVYHDLSHIYQCLKALDELSIELSLDEKSKAGIELALWYHDVVYDPFSKTNESDSADRLAKELAQDKTELNLKLVDKMIRASTHRTESSSTDRGEGETSQPAEQAALDLFLDIDLGILGQSPEAYDRYAKQIRQEYKRVPFFLFYPGRKKLLKELIKKPIYRSALFKEKFEKQAKLNIERELRGWRYQFLP